MILYFANRNMEILGHAATSLRAGYVIRDDRKTEDVETGVATFEFRVSWANGDEKKLKEMATVGNYLLRKNGAECEAYVIVDAEKDTKNREVWVNAEDTGLDLLNEIADEYTAPASHPITTYINKWIGDSGFEIGINECPDSTTRKLSWDGESTVTGRLASIATQFGNYEISYSFAIKGMTVTNKYVNIHKQRGKDMGAQLRLNRDIDRIITKESIANLATGLKCAGGTPEDAENPITLKGYKYDDGDFYVGESGYLYSRKASQKWGRFAWKEVNPAYGGVGFIIRPYSYDTTDQATLCSHAVAELKKICDMEVNYEVEISKLPDDIKIGDRVNIIDDAGELYLSTRILLLETSVTEKTQRATLGEHLIKSSGISQKVADLAEQFAATAQKATRAYKIAEVAQGAAENAQVQADAAVKDAEAAALAAGEAEAAANTATQAAAEATEKANAAQAAVDVVESEVSALETTVLNAQQAAENAQQAAETAQAKADEAATAAQEAQTDAAEAKEAAGTAQGNAQTAIEKAEAAQGTADTAKSEAEAAQETAAAAKADAAAAQEDINALGDELETVSQTMTADYARKTDLTESEAKLQTQITQNAGQIESTAKKVTEVDETANNAAELAQAAQNSATAAQNIANAATADAEAAQKAADDAAAAAEAAQSEADTAKQAAATAQGVADKAAEDLAAAEADLATVTGRVDATEADILAAQEAVNAAQTAADNAQAEADLAAEKAATAQNTADTAVTNAANAQTAANNAADKATAAQAAADKAQGDATAAQTKANEAAQAAAAAQSTADTAKANATAAQNKANEAAAAAAAADQAAKDADAKAAQAQTDLETARQNLADVTSRVDATEDEVEAAKAAVDTAQAAADKAKEDAAAAQSTADKAKADAATAQTAATNAKTAADNAKAAADAAQEAAEAAQADVDALAVRVTTAETKITQNSEKIALMATKEEVTETLGGYYTKEETAGLLEVESDRITSSVSRTYATKGELSGVDTKAENAQAAADNAAESAEAANNAASQAQADIDNMEIGGRNLIRNSKNMIFDDYLFKYKRLAYIEVTGEQYIDTGFKSNQDTRIVGRFKYFGGNGIYGARSSVSSRNFSMRVISSKWQMGYDAGVTTGTIASDTTNWHTVDHNKNNLYIDGELAATRDYVEFTTPYAAAIGAIRAGSLYPGEGQYDTWQIYDNGTMVRDYIPRQDSDGTIGMYDALHSVFYTNAGTGEFIAGEVVQSSIVESAVTTAPTGREEECAKFILADAANTYELHGVVAEGQKYTISFFAKSDAAGCITFRGEELQTNAEWVKFTHTFEADNDVVYLDFAAGTYYLFNAKLEEGDKATGWIPATEDVDAATTNAQTSADAAQETASDAQGRVAVAESDIEQLANAISMLVTDENGASLMKQTSTGWTFDMSEITAELLKASEALSAVEETVGTVEEGKTVSGMIENLGQLIGDLQNRTAYIDMKTDTAGNPVLELGKRNDNEGFKVAITNSTITFRLGSIASIRLENRDGVGYVVADKLIVEDELRVGNFKWVLHNGSMGLLYEEVAE